MNEKWLEETRAFLNQPDDVYEEAPMIALELLEVVDELRAELKLAEEGLTEGSTRPHSGSAECPTWYNLCNCNIDTLIYNIERAEKAEAALRELIKTADPETNMSMIPLADALARARRVLGEADAGDNENADS